MNGLKLAAKIFNSILDYLIYMLQDISKEYRSVSKILDIEKQAEKEKNNQVVNKKAFLLWLLITFFW